MPRRWLRLAVAACVLAREARSAEGGGAQVRLGLGADGNLIVGWSTAACLTLDCPAAVVRVWPLGKTLAEGSTVGAQNSTRWRGRLWHLAELDHLADGEEYVYQVSSTGGANFGPELRLRVPPAASQPAKADEKLPPLRMVVLGDFAEGPDSREIVTRIDAGPEYDAAMHLGDIAGNLSDEEGRRGDRFIDMVKPIASKVPYMTLPGDRDDLDMYDMFFQMRQLANQSVRGMEQWRAWSAGRARVLMLSTACLLGEDTTPGPGGGHAAARRQQLAWLRRELKRSSAEAERMRRPWVIVTGHKPMYCTLEPNACGEEAAKLRALLEPLFLEFKVDLYLSAHVHAYERSFPVRNRTLCPNQPRKLTHMLRRPCAPVHIMNGDAGVPLLGYDEALLPAMWTAQRHAGSAGFGELTIHNATHLQYRQLDVGGAVTDELWLRHVRTWQDEGEEGEENFLEAVFWLAFATGVLLSTMGFIRWAHTDGLKRRDEAIRELRVELSVLSGLPIQLGVGDEVRGLASPSGHGLH